MFQMSFDLRVINLLRLQEVFKLETKSFYNLANLIHLYETFKLKTKSFSDLTNLIRL